MADGFTKGDTLVGVTGGIFKCAFGETCTARRINQTLHLKIVHDIEETHAFLTDPVAFVNLDIIEINFACTQHVPANFMQRINLYARFI